MPHLISPFSSVFNVDFGQVNISWVYFVTLPTAQYNKKFSENIFLYQSGIPKQIWKSYSQHFLKYRHLVQKYFDPDHFSHIENAWYRYRL